MVDLVEEAGSAVEGVADGAGLSTAVLRTSFLLRDVVGLGTWRDDDDPDGG